MRTLRRLLAGGIAATLVAATGCASETDLGHVAADRPPDFAATPDYLTQVADNSSDQAYRFELTMGFEGLPAGVPAGVNVWPTTTGMIDAEGRLYARQDLSGSFMLDEDLAEGMDDDDLVTEMIVDGDTVYERAPVYEAMADDFLPRGSAERELREAAAEGWIAIDRAVLGDSAGELVNINGLDPVAYLGVVRAAESVEELGPDEIDGDFVMGLAADIPMADLAEAQTEGSTTTAPTPPTTDELDEALGQLGEVMGRIPMSIEVWVDSEGRLRRLTVAQDIDSVTEAFGDEGDDPPPFPGFGVAINLDIGDYGDDSISIDIPDDARDMTETAREVFES